MGEVWLCRDDALGVDRAVKFLLPERAGDAALRARFAAEARTLAALGGVSGVVRVHAAGEDPATRRPFFVMDAHLLAPDEVRAVCTRRLGLPAAAAEAVVRATSESHAEFAENPFTLQDALGDEAAGTARQLPERAVLSLAREIAAALARLHGRAPPVVHRDLKPSNLLFAADGRLLLADFGVAKTLDAARTGLTRTGAQPGTQRYAAPELLRGDPATPASDWYSLGVVLFRALTSSFPQWGEAFPTRAGLRPFSPLWEPLLRNLLAPDPVRRLADPAEFSRRLDALEKALDRPRGGRRRAKAVAVAFAAIALLGAGIAAFRHAESGPHAESAEFESHAENAEFAESESHAENAESAEHRGEGGGAGEAEPPSAAAHATDSGMSMSDVYAGARLPSQPPRRSASSAAGITAFGMPRELDTSRYPDGPGEDPAYVDPDDIREFLPVIERIAMRAATAAAVNGNETNRDEFAAVAERYRKSYAPYMLVTAERLRREVDAGETPSEKDFHPAVFPRDAWEAWLARRRAKDGSVGPSPGEVRTVMLPGGVPLDLVWVPPGTFTMGLSEKERSPCVTPSGTIPGDKQSLAPLRPASIPRGFWLAKTELTQEQYAKIVYGEEGRPGFHATCPQTLSWNRAEQTIWSLNRLGTGFAFRMPTEAEWEWAARGGPLGGGHAWSGSDDPDDVAWTADSWPPKGKPVPVFWPDVATKRPNELGLFDMSGLFAEWCSDRYNPPTPFSDAEYRVVRGGDVCTSAAHCRNGSFNAVSVNGDQGNWIGLRVAADALP